MFRLPNTSKSKIFRGSKHPLTRYLEEFGRLGQCVKLGHVEKKSAKKFNLPSTHVPMFLVRFLMSPISPLVQRKIPMPMSDQILSKLKTYTVNKHDMFNVRFNLTPIFVGKLFLLPDPKIFTIPSMYGIFTYI